jgi:uncharacterized protein (DUF1800 family)
LETRGKEAAALALHRFGFGPNLGTSLGTNLSTSLGANVGANPGHETSAYSIATIAGDPRGALLSDLDRPNAGYLAVKLPSSAAAARAISDYRAEEQAKSKLAQRAKKEAEANGMAANANDAATPTPSKPQETPLPQQILQNEAAARYEAAVDADIGFVERLVWFWSNHFCISADKDIAMVGAYEREAIRAHALGHFADMLQAVESHPAMLYYLDNVRSMGANSVAGINGDKGLNENLAREILELHTLGVRSGYSQADVTSFANVLTGWTSTDAADPAHGGEFLFNKRLHEPGQQTVLGKFYAGTGVDQGRAVLADLARHTATAQHIAQKLACHFVADTPPPPLVAKLAKSFMDSDGNLKTVAKTLVTADEAWVPARTKLKRPSEWIVGVLRLTGGRWNANSPFNIGRVLSLQATLGESLWRPPAPNGWSDTEAAWIDGVPRRLDIANELAGRLPSADPAALLESGLGPPASNHTRQTIAHAESRTQALALLLMAPEFLRR